MSFVQLVQRTYSCEKLPRGVDPVFEFELAEHEELVGIVHSWRRDYSERKTVDHIVVCWVAVRL